MSRKSLSKKELISWLNCENCGINILSNDEKLHHPICELNQLEEFKKKHATFIYKNRIYSNSFEIVNGETNFLLENLRQIIYLNETIIRICKWKIGDNVLVNVKNEEYSEGALSVKTILPISENTLKVILIPKESYQSINFNGTQLEIYKLSEDILIADEIEIISLCEEEIAQNSANEIEFILKKLNYNNCLMKSNQLSISFFNKTLNFKILSIKCRKLEDNEDVLTEAMINLKLTERFFRVSSKTTFRIVKNIIMQKQLMNEEMEVKKAFGLDDVIAELKQIMNLAFGNTKYNSIGNITRGVLLYGPPGCGKTLICDIFSKLCKCAVINVTSNEIFSKYYGESEANLTGFFEKAFSNYPKPTLIIIEELNNLCQKSSNVDAIKRISSLLCSLMDRLHNNIKGSKTFVLATADNPDNLTTSIRRSGRLDCEIEIPVPNPETRKAILMNCIKNYDHRLNESDVDELSKITHGYVGVDLLSLISKASSMDGCLVLRNINIALNHIKPSAMREVLIESPNVKWTDIGGQHDLKLKLKQAVEWPITHPEVFERLGIHPPRGVLMFGPPGCSKTLIAKALATESHLNFISIKGPELFSMWVGESERAVRELFRKARQVAPSIIFFDEIDAIGSERSSESGSSVKERVLAQILTEIDGVNALNNVVIVAATNRPDLIDKALLRPGRIDRIIYVQLPDLETRKEIFKIKLSKMAISDNVDLDELARITDGYSGAEIQAICNEAALKVLEEDVNALHVEKEHFDYACVEVQPRTSKDLLNLYEKYLKEF